jgi:hypothetical protein
MNGRLRHAHLRGIGMERWGNTFASPSGESCHCDRLQSLGDHPVGSVCSVGAANWTCDGVRHLSIYRLNIKGIMLPTSTFDLDGGHNL